MRNGGFALKPEGDRTEGGGKFRRGHLDIVVLNPTFVARHTYQQLKAQNFELFIRDVWNGRDEAESMLLHAIEFYLFRDEIKESRGADQTLAARRCAKAIIQDADKLDAAAAMPGFAATTLHVAFLKGTGETVGRMIEDAIGQRKGIRLIFAP